MQSGGSHDLVNTSHDDVMLRGSSAAGAHGSDLDSEDESASRNETAPLLNKHAASAASSSSSSSGPDGKKDVGRERRVHVNGDGTWHEGEAIKTGNNAVTTSKYTVLTFIPKNLVEQFRRLANIYFLMISGFQLIPGLSPTGRFTTLVPLVIVLTITALKEIIEDIARHRQDAAVNNTEVEVVRGGRLVVVKWHEVRVGEIVRLQEDQYIPADLILLSSSLPHGTAYIQTANLDGETNLKIRQALPETSHLTDYSTLATMRGDIECEGPSRHLYNFSGSLYMEGNPPLSIGVKQLLLRGAMVRNTEWAYGVTIYTGHDTRLMQNSTESPHKRSNVERATNWMILAVFAMQLLLCAAAAVANAVYTRQLEDSWYLQVEGSAAANGALSFITFIILLNNLIPISLYITMEIVKFGQAYFINNDLRMYHEASDTPAQARTSNLNEELGQISYIFSDKTGTLTQNRMLFRSCTVAGTVYGIPHTATTNPDADDDEDEDEDDGVETTAPLLTKGGEEFTLTERGAAGEGTEEAFDGQQLVAALNAQDPTEAHTARQFLTLLAVCHTVVPQAKPDGSVAYMASSPDEAALVSAAQSMGFVFHYREPTSITVNVEGQDLDFELLNILEFTSDRKRMSVICRCPDGRIRLYVKGADDVIFARLREEDHSYAKVTMKHLQEFASAGLRTLCCAYAELDEEVYRKWNKEYQRAAVAILLREQRVAEAADKIERELVLLGATGIEDKLQDGVPETIVKLSQAGIKIWVLTGDRQETAINIGYASGQLTADTDVIVLNVANPGSGSTKRHIEQALTRLRQSVTTRAGVVIDGETLIAALEPDTRGLFLELCQGCKAVICCRVSPLQKAEVVRLVRENVRGAITLAIGDGANDVSMIKEAHVGVGISGEEGLQAARASDYAIAQFRFLSRLLLVHGRHSYHRLAKVILYSFYKNIVLYLTQYWYNLYNGWSGQSLYERWTLALYNVLFTLLPVIVVGFFDRDVSDHMALRYPGLYATSRQRTQFNLWVFLGWLVNSVLHSIVVVVVVAFSHGDGIGDQTGQPQGLWYMGSLSYAAVLLLVTLKLALEIRSWTYLHHIAVWGSFLVFLAFQSVWQVTSAIPFFPFGQEVFFVIYRQVATGQFYFVLIITVFIALLRDVTWKYVVRAYRPDTYHIIQEVEKEQRKRKRKTDRTAPPPYMGYSYSEESGGTAEAIAYGTFGKKHL